MFAVIYRFSVKPELKDQFIKAWKELTAYIYKHEGSLGSRLHKENEESYISYAQWRSKEQFDNAGANLPEEADEVRKLMRKACTQVDRLHEINLVEDLLKTSVYPSAEE